MADVGDVGEPACWLEAICLACGRHLGVDVAVCPACGQPREPSEEGLGDLDVP